MYTPPSRSAQSAKDSRSLVLLLQSSKREAGRGYSGVLMCRSDEI
jgi:hypothetical protein